MRTIVGEDLQRLFAARERGTLDEIEFFRRKAALLDWSRCRLSLFTPKTMRFRG